MENNVVWGQGINPVIIGDFPGAYYVVNNTIAYNMWAADYGNRDYAFVAAYPDPTAAAIDLTLVNNIFAFNTGPAQGSPTGIYLGPNVNLVKEGNNLYWSRDDGEIQAEFLSGDGEVTRNELTDGTWASATGQGAGNVVADPNFVSGWPNVDLHLTSGSPAVNAADSAESPVTDLEGTTRPQSAGHDIGGYER
jgi:hypothetical protein